MIKRQPYITPDSTIKEPDFITADEVAMKLGIGRTKAYAIIHQLNLELQSKGHIAIIPGRVSRKYFYERVYI